MSRWSTSIARVGGWLDDPRHQGVRNWLQRVLFVGIAFLLWRQLHDIDWNKLAANLPANPLFYALAVVQYCTLPTFDMLIYQHVWKRRLWRSFGVFLQKRAYNFGVFAFSGEALFTLWARRGLGLSDEAVVSAVKDVNILSAVASSIFTVFCLGALALLGGQVLAAIAGAVGQTLLWAGIGASVAMAAVPLVLRRHLMALSPAMSWQVTALHGARIVVVTGLQVAQWSLVIPDAPLAMWLLFVTTNFTINRLPFLPNKDLLVLGVVLGMIGVVAADPTRLTALFVTTAALMMLGNLLVIFIGAAARVAGGGPIGAADAKE